MGILQETIKGVETKAKELPLLGHILGKEDITVDQYVLGSQVGKVMLLGGGDRKPENVQRIVSTFDQNDLLSEGTGVNIRTIVPEVTDEDFYRGLGTAADLLAQALLTVPDNEGDVLRHTVSVEAQPITVPTDDRSRLTQYAYASLSEALAEDTMIDPTQNSIILGNPRFLADAFPRDITAHSMVSGAVAVLAEVGSRPEANRFELFWPSMPSGYIYAVR